MVQEKVVPASNRVIGGTLFVMLLYLLTFVLYTPIHEGFHALGCIGTGLEITTLDWTGAVDCTGLGELVIPSFIVYSAPYIFGLGILAVFHYYEDKLRELKHYRYLAGVISVIYVDMLVNGLLAMTVASITGVYEAGRTDLVTLAGMSMELAYPLLLLFAVTSWLWYVQGRKTMQEFYETLVSFKDKMIRRLRNRYGVSY